MGSSGSSDGKESTWGAGDLSSISGSGKYPEKGMATYSNILACRIPWIEKPVRSLLQFIESQKVGHNWMTNPHRIHQKRKVEKAIIYVHISIYHNEELNSKKEKDDSLNFLN